MRITTYAYDFRGRRLNETGELNHHVAYVYDSLNRLVQTERFDGPAGNLLGREEMLYDDRGRVYQQIVHGVDPATGNVTESLVSANWYDAAGNLVKSQELASQLTSKRVYDGLGRAVADFTGYSTVSASYAEATSIDDEIVLEQLETLYNDAGHVLQVTRYARHHDDTSSTGALSTGNARRSYQAFWYDGGGRRVAMANYGTNGGSGLTRPATAPAPSDDVLVSTFEYDDAGREHLTTDPAGIVTRTFFDDAGRATHVVENYAASAWTSEPNQPAARDSDVNRVTAYAYTADGQIANLTAINPSADGSTADNQITRYVYGTTLAESDVARTDLLQAIIYPDSDNWDENTQQVATGADWDRVELAYNRQGELTRRTDQREVTHVYDYDALGRPLHDRVTDLGRSEENVDEVVRRLSRSYEVRGMVASVTSHDDAAYGSGQVLNEVTYTYNDFGQLIEERQAYDGAVDGNTPAIGYGYADGFDPIHGIRLEHVTYPNGRRVHAVYNGHGNIDHQIGRVTALVEDDGFGQPSSASSDEIVRYDYLGMQTPVNQAYPNPAIQLTRIGDPMASDPYSATATNEGGFDRFGRLARQQWQDASDPQDPLDVLHVTHGYDRASNRTHADRHVYRSFAQAYDYDQLHRLNDFRAGATAYDGQDQPDGIASHWTLKQQTWNLDQLGNQLELSERGDVTWSRNTPNAANEITAREVRADQGKPVAGPFELGANLSHWEVPEADNPADTDEIGLASGHVVVQSVKQGTYDGIQQPEAAAIVLLDAPEIGQTGFSAWIPLAHTPEDAEVGIVFAYQSPNDYWIKVQNKTDGYNRTYHVLDGQKIQKTHSNVSHPQNMQFVRSHGGHLAYSFDLEDGFPPGRIGFYSTAAGTRFDIPYINEDSETRMLAGRWRHWASNAGWDNIRFLSANNRLGIGHTKNHGGPANTRIPILLEGRHLDRFEATFSFQNESSTWRPIRFLFDALDANHYSAITIQNNGAPSNGFEMVDGRAPDSVQGTSRSWNMSSGSTHWYRVIRDDNEITILQQASENEPTTWDPVNDRVYDSSNFTFRGGLIGFSEAGEHLQSVGDLTLKSDTNGDGTYDTTEHIEGFAVDQDGYAHDDPTHDAAGNLTYDGVYRYSYDAWNRLVAVTKAYRDSQGDIQEGSTIQKLEYDAQGRRIVQRVMNSAYLDMTQHYYYAGQSVVEVRNGSNIVLKQKLWAGTFNIGDGYIDQLLQVAHNEDPFATDGSEAQCEIVFYALHDANYNLLALVDEDGTIAERYEYTPYGQRTVYFSPGPNDPLAMAPTTISRRWQVAGVSQPYGLNSVGHQGLSHDEVTGLVHNRARMLHPRLGRFMQRDPLNQNMPGGGYHDGMSLYQYVGSNSLTAYDPEGMAEIRRGGWALSCIRVTNNYRQDCSAERERECCDSENSVDPFSCCARNVSGFVCAAIAVAPRGVACMLSCLNRCIYDHYAQRGTPQWGEADDACNEHGICHPKCCEAMANAEQNGLTQCVAPCQQQCQSWINVDDVVRSIEGMRQAFGRSLCCN
ncbi:RHS repeat-associated core domain-containing protein [Phycisphaerales bacterium AB-hyl4]|uniref:RHS repeat-associated core domain-containing protein n=1 Tax=Natronomicrosphaera hydrolytica TaxID=3242702 RepID=A0ABV4U801_9BACT